MLVGRTEFSTRWERAQHKVTRSESFLLFSRLLGWFFLWRGIIHGYFDKVLKGAVNG